MQPQVLTAAKSGGSRCQFAYRFTDGPVTCDLQRSLATAQSRRTLFRPTAECIVLGMNVWAPRGLKPQLRWSCCCLFSFSAGFTPALLRSAIAPGRASARTGSTVRLTICAQFSPSVAAENVQIAKRVFFRYTASSYAGGQPFELTANTFIAAARKARLRLDVKLLMKQRMRRH